MKAHISDTMKRVLADPDARRALHRALADGDGRGTVRLDGKLYRLASRTVRTESDTQTQDAATGRG